MANQAMGTTMGNPACEWVRARLPLWVGVNDDPTERNGERDDLSPEDCQSIEEHLGACPSCRQHQADLERACHALAECRRLLCWLPLMPRRSGRCSRRGWRPMMHAPARHGFERCTGSPTEGSRALTDLDGERPTPIGLDARQPGGSPGGCRSVAAGDTGAQRPGRAAGSRPESGGTIGLEAGLGHGGRSGGGDPGAGDRPAGRTSPARRRPVRHPRQCRAAGGPRPCRQSRPRRRRRRLRTSRTTETSPHVSWRRPSRSRCPRPRRSGHEASPASRTATPSRLNFDLEHGTPMPPGRSRDAKPVY